MTFLELYEAFGVELAIAVTNVTRACVEMLHVKTSPHYPIRKAVRMSMSIPLLINPARCAPSAHTRPHFNSHIAL